MYVLFKFGFLLIFVMVTSIIKKSEPQLTVYKNNNNWQLLNYMYLVIIIAINTDNWRIIWIHNAIHVPGSIKVVLQEELYHIN